MPEDSNSTETKNMEASNAAALAEEARQRAHEAQTAKVVDKTLTEFFAAQTERERFISTQRIPFICADIRETRKAIEDLVKALSESNQKLFKYFEDRYVTKERFWPVERGFYALVALLLSLLITAIVMLALGKHL